MGHRFARRGDAPVRSGDDRIHHAPAFRFGKAAASTTSREAEALFRLDAAIVTALADNQIGRLVEDLI